MTVAIVILLAVLTLEVGVLLWALIRPLLALGRITEAGAEVAETVGRFTDAMKKGSARIE